jgi:capsular exopolysaccharide synthesis family protein
VSFLELRDYIEIVSHRKWIIIWSVLAVMTLAIVLSALQTPSFSSDVLILSEANTAGESVLGSYFSAALFDPDRFIKTQAEIIKTPEMAEGVHERLTAQYDQIRNEQELGGGRDKYLPEYVPGPSELLGMVQVQQVERTSTFRITVTATNRYLARDVAQVYAEVYLNNRKTSAIIQLEEAREAVWNRIQELQGEIEEVTAKIDAYGITQVPESLKQEALRAANLWTSLWEKYVSLRISEALQQGGLEIVKNAVVGSQVGPRPVRNGVLGLFVGLLLGVGLAFLWEYLDDTLKTREDFEKSYDAPILGEIAYVASEEERGYEIIYASQPEHPSVEGYRSLRTNLQFLGMEKSVKSILVTSARPEEGKSTVLVNLAVALSEMGRRVTLIEADLRRPVLEKFLWKDEADGAARTGPEGGLTAVLAGNIGFEEALLDSPFPNLKVLTSGIMPPNPAELVSSGRMEQVIELAKESADFVLVDAPPILAISDSVALSPMVDGVLLVALYGSADRDSSRHCVNLLRKVNANVIGVVINNVTPLERYGYYHYYYYHPVGEEKMAGKATKRLGRLLGRPGQRGGNDKEAG